MNQAPLATAVHSLRKAVASTAEDPGDRQLLRDFLGQRDEVAFALLVRRHGPMVHGVCRRVLQHTQDAEDAFQAAFLVLARKADTIRKGEALAGWLHGVSYRIAMRAKRDAGRRRKHETRTPPPPTTAPAADEASWREVQAALDEEVERLSAAYRSAFVLCCLQGASQADAARQLGVKEGTISSRLTAARKRLRAALARRSISLSAVLAGLALADGARAAVPVSAARATARSATRFAAGDMVDGLSAKAVTLAEGALTIMFATRITLATLLLLVTGLAGALALGLQHHSAAAEPPPAVEKATKPPAPAKEKTDVVEVKGRVLDPEGKGFTGARVRLWTGPTKSKDAPVRAITGADGRFRFSARKAALGPGATIVVTAGGLGPDWVRLPPTGAGDGLTLRLGREIPLEGRILNLEGRPVAGAAVEVLNVEKPAGKDLTAWLESWKRDRWPEVSQLDAAALGMPRTTTDGNGRFTLQGFGRERAVFVRVSGDHIEKTAFWVLTRPGNGPAAGLKRRGYWAAYLARFDHLVGPTKPVVGTVRDKRTGKLLAGIKVARSYEGEVHEPLFATTDAQGRYRLAGGPKRPTYLISVGGKPGLPYFDRTRRDVRDTPGLEPVTADLEMERGLELSGRLLDEAGKPVRGRIRVQYAHLPDNPHLKDYPYYANPGFRFIVSNWGVATDGRFVVPAIPGPGVLIVETTDDHRFAVLEPTKELHAKYKIFLMPRSLHAVVPVNPSTDDPKSLRQDIRLLPGRSLTGRVVGPDGKPLAGVHVAGGWAFEKTLFLEVHKSKPLKGTEFTAHGLNPRHPQTLVFFHPKKRLARVLTIRGNEEPLRVRLRPLGTVGGRLVDASRRPVKGAEVSALFQPTYRQMAALNLPATELVYHGLLQLLREDTAKQKKTTDDNGTFRIEGLVPGLPYELMLKSGDRVAHWVSNVIPANGRETKLGDLKAGGKTDLGSPALKLTPEDRGND